MYHPLIAASITPPHSLGNSINWKLGGGRPAHEGSGGSPLAGELNKLETSGITTLNRWRMPSPHSLGNSINWKLQERHTRVWTGIRSPLAGELNKLETLQGDDPVIDIQDSPLAGELNKLETSAGFCPAEVVLGLPTRWGTQ